MRFRLKLSIVLVGLALIPLIGATLVVQELLGRNETSRVDGQLDSAAAAAAVAYRAQLADARQLAVAIAARPDVQRAFVERSGAGLDLTGLTGGLPVQLVDRQGPLAGTPPIGPAARISVQVGPPAARRRLLVWLPIDAQLLDQIVANSGRADHVDLALVAGGRVVASTSGKLGLASPLRPGTSQDASLGGTAVRAQAVALPLARGGPGELVSAYPQSRISDTVNSMRLRVIVPAALLALLAIGLALLAADRISRALSDLAARALALARSTPSESSDGDELVVLGAAIDTMSGELSTRMDELEAERGRLKLTLARYGETLAATHDLRALLGAVLDTAVQATRARGGRLMLYDGERGEAVEQTRIGTARGSRTDLPMVVAAGRGLEGEALQAQEPRSADTPRSVVAVPILREHQLLGLVTVVDPEEGTFGADDVETLAGLAVQAGVAIENARLHRVVEQQAISDGLTGLANRRQFYEVLGREYERAQRFGQPLALILLDIDDFKQINDSRGHLAGDAVLHGVAATLSGLIREIDLAARYGGEEFAVLLPQTSLEGAGKLAERLRAEIQARRIPFGDQPISGVTASFGVAAGPQEGGQLALVESADSALYQAKREGKNTVTLAGTRA